MVLAPARAALVLAATAAAAWPVGGAGASTLTPTALRLTAGATVQAGWHATSWAVPLVLKGKATAGTTVTASVPCAIATCSASAVTTSAGIWSARIDAVEVPGTTSLTLTITTDIGSEQADLTVVAPTEAAPGRRTVAVIGDSLAVGTAALLPARLTGRRVTTEAMVGRTLSQGLDLFAHTPIDANLSVAVFSLFTNDDPSQPQRLINAVRSTSARLGKGRCAVWLTIRRPKVGKTTYKGVNAALLAEAARSTYGGRLIVVDWYAQIAANHKLLSGDRVHPTAAGYTLRAQLIADAIKRCPVSPK